ncbi:MAG TPA: DUF1028 domain-containing protein [Acidobacteriota bacterium]|nr:DUF1028 domain-containing protein [Acidobacteriota bacterium]
MFLTWTLSLLLLAGQPQARPSQLAHTYSIVAYDQQTGEVGGAVQSHWFSVGSIVVWAQAGVGAVATQSFVNVDYGPLGLRAMASGQEPAPALERLTQDDPGQAVRQVAFVDVSGRVAAHTGDKCIRYHCDIQGEGFSVQANMMLESTVCQAMAESFRNSRGSLARRLLAALQAAQGQGGDIRGRQSAALKVVSASKPEQPWGGVTVDIRVDDHERPLQELGRLLTVQEGYNDMNAGDLAIERGQMEQALQHYARAEEKLPGRLEPRYWHAVQLVSVGRLEESLPIFKEIFAQDENWLKLTRRLVEVDLLPEDPKILEAIEKQAP